MTIGSILRPVLAPLIRRTPPVTATPAPNPTPTPTPTSSPAPSPAPQPEPAPVPAANGSSPATAPSPGSTAAASPRSDPADEVPAAPISTAPAERPARFSMREEVARAVAADAAPTARTLFAVPEPTAAPESVAEPDPTRSRAEVIAAAAYAVVGQMRADRDVLQLIKTG